VTGLLATQQEVEYLGVGLRYPSGTSNSLNDIVSKRQQRFMATALNPKQRASLGVLNALLAEVAVIDREGIILFTNESWSRFANENAANGTLISGVGLSYLDVCRSASSADFGGANEMLAGLEDVLNGRTQQFCAEYACHSPTQRRWFLLQATRLCTPIRGAILLHVDITGRKLLEERLESLHTEKTHWLAMAVHDLRNPVSAITANSQVLEQELAGAGAEEVESLRNINSATEFLLKLLDDLLDISAIESGTSDSTRELTDLRSVVGESVALLRHLVAGKGITIETHYSEGIPPLKLDRRQMTQVLLNLLENAIKFCPNYGRVDITVGSGAANVAIEVQDNGPGIPPDGVETIFMPFQRLAGASSQRGTGLGLAICKRIIAGHGGRIWAENAVGGGAVFHISLPLEVPTRGT
jgi:signal transduction histidine kinase